ncbi:hypothetical protein [Paraburkholderia sp. BCC1884]|uniref:hypothetical protein n=1 Tax=Paraburkholderia sp. BCC1884 TaxID=2562668 RepID=UPI001181CC11|nr:hypothetical protein [Paraburkholderia sp. BCC1884]
MKNRYLAFTGGESTEWYRVYQAQRIFSPKSTYTPQYRKRSKPQASLDLVVSGKYCLTPGDIRAAIPARFQGQGKLKDMLGLFAPTGEKLNNSTLFFLTDDKACLKSVSFWAAGA